MDDMTRLSISPDEKVDNFPESGGSSPASQYVANLLHEKDMEPKLSYIEIVEQ